MTPQEAEQHYRAMGEPPSSIAYLMRLMFDGEPVLVRAPAPLTPCELTGDPS